MQFNCPSCGRSLAAPEGVFGQEGQCKFCGVTIVSPHAEGASATLKSPGGPSFIPQPPPSSGGGAPPPAAQYPPPGSQYSPPGGSYSSQYASSQQGSGLAIASLVFGILGLITCGLFSIIGLICGIIALGKTGSGSGREGGRSMAVAGTVVSAISVLMIPILAAILFPVFAKARDTAQTSSCLSNVKQLGVAIQAYSQDYQEHLPPSRTWNTAIKTYLPPASGEVFACPKVQDGSARYRMNASVGGISVATLPSPISTVVLFDAAPGAVPFGGPRDVEARHTVRIGEDTSSDSSYSERRPAATFGMADGRAQLAQPSKMPIQAWQPGGAYR